MPFHMVVVLPVSWNAKPPSPSILRLAKPFPFGKHLVLAQHPVLASVSTF
jgi:hypothetical protein